MWWFSGVQPLLPWHPTYPAIRTLSACDMTSHDLNLYKAAGDCLPCGFPPSQFWSSNKRLKNLILGQGKVWSENESGPTHFSSWNYSFYPLPPFTFSLLTVIPLPRSPPLSILSAETVTFKDPPNTVISQSFPKSSSQNSHMRPCKFIAWGSFLSGHYKLHGAGELSSLPPAP